MFTLALKKGNHAIVATLHWITGKQVILEKKGRNHAFFFSNN